MVASTTPTRRARSQPRRGVFVTEGSVVPVNYSDQVPLFWLPPRSTASLARATRHSTARTCG